MCLEYWGIWYVDDFENILFCWGSFNEYFFICFRMVFKSYSMVCYSIFSVLSRVYFVNIMFYSF